MTSWLMASTQFVEELTGRPFRVADWDWYQGAFVEILGDKGVWRGIGAHVFDSTGSLILKWQLRI